MGGPGLHGAGLAPCSSSARSRSLSRSSLAVGCWSAASERSWRSIRVRHRSPPDVSRSLPEARYAVPAQGPAFWSALFERLPVVPGIRNAGGVSELPLSNWRNMGTFETEGRTFARADRPHANWRSVSAGYFATMGIAVVDGRPFGARDAYGSPASRSSTNWPGPDTGERRIPSAGGSRSRVMRSIARCGRDRGSRPNRSSQLARWRAVRTRNMFPLKQRARDCLCGLADRRRSADHGRGSEVGRAGHRIHGSHLRHSDNGGQAR